MLYLASGWEAEQKYPEVQYVLKMSDAGWEGRGFGRVRANARAFTARLLAEEIPFRVKHSESRAVITTGNQIEKVPSALSTLGNPDLLIFYLDDDTQRPDVACACPGFPRQNLIRFTDAPGWRYSHPAQHTSIKTLRAMFKLS